MREHCIRRPSAVVAVAVGVSLLLGTGRASAAPELSEAGRPRVTPPTAARAYTFLNQMMDRYATGTVPRLVES